MDHKDDKFKLSFVSDRKGFFNNDLTKLEKCFLELLLCYLEY